MTTIDRATTARLTWEPFDPVVIGYEVLAGWLRQFYSGQPWNEYVKCFTCSALDDFTFKGTWGRGQLVNRAGPLCPECGDELQSFWSPERTRAFFRALGKKGRLTGLTVRSDGAIAGCLLGVRDWARDASGLGAAAGGRRRLRG
jgi:hypothetical protein